MKLFVVLLSVVGVGSADELACHKVHTKATLAGGSGCAPINNFQRCILELNLGEPATSEALADVATEIQRCEPIGESPTFQTVEGSVEITVDQRRSVTFKKRKAESVDIWDLAEKVEEARQMGDTFEARFADAKTTVNQMAIDAVKECNALGPALTAKMTETSATLNKVAVDLQASVKVELEGINKKVDDDVTTAIETLTDLSAKSIECGKTGTVPSSDSKTCVGTEAVTLQVYKDVTDLPKCTTSRAGELRWTGRRGVLRCADTKWQVAVAPPLGTTAGSPLKDCTEAKTEYYVENVLLSGRYWILKESKAVNVFCDLKAGKEVQYDGKAAARAGKSCKHILENGGEKKNGYYWINPDEGTPFQVYCEQETEGGGWILLQHTTYGRGSNPCGKNNEYKRVYDQWVNDDIGPLTMFGSTPGNILKKNLCYFMKFKNWFRIAGNSDSAGVVDQLKMVGDPGFSSGIVMKDFFVSPKFGLRMSNDRYIRQMMCGDASDNNCFSSQNIGFSTRDKDHDSYGPHCAATNHYDGTGWWYAHCYHHNEFQPGMNQEQFGGCQGSSRGKHNNCNTQHWTWFVK